MNLTLNQKRFLIAWIIFHSFALFVNLAKVKGEYYSKTKSIGTDTMFLFTGLQTTEKFWPFTVYNRYIRRIDTISKYQTFEGKLYKSPTINTIEYIDHSFNGIFNSYDTTEYIFYIILGFGIVYLPKIWNDQLVKASH